MGLQKANASTHNCHKMASQQLHSRQVRQVYLITYSRADLTQFPTRESFSLAVINAFAQMPAKILHWVVAQEEHEDGGMHFHMAVKLDRRQRWLQVWNFLQCENNINVNTSVLIIVTITRPGFMFTREDLNPLTLTRYEQIFVYFGCEL